MDNFNFYSPTEFVFGKNRENETGIYVKKFGGSRVLIHYGGGSAVKSGLLDRVKASLEEKTSISLPFSEKDNECYLNNNDSLGDIFWLNKNFGEKSFIFQVLNLNSCKANR